MSRLLDSMESPRPIGLTSKRVIDIVLAVSGIILLAPLLIICYVATILTSAVRDVAGALGNLATEVFELRDAARRANAEHDRPDLHAVDDVEIVRDEA
jgi:hypothetical protein